MSPTDRLLTIDLFGVLTRLAGAPSITLPVRAGGTVADALALLAAARPGTGAVLAQCACAVGDRLVARTHAVGDGERLALLPPVSGG